MKAVIPLAIFASLTGLFLYVLGKMDDGEYNPRAVPTEFIGRPAPTFDLPNLLAADDRVVSADYDLDGFMDLAVSNGLLFYPVSLGGPDTLLRNQVDQLVAAMAAFDVPEGVGAVMPPEARTEPRGQPARGRHG